MTKIRIKVTGKVMEVQPERAKELVEKGEATYTAKTPGRPTPGYNTRKINPQQIKTK